MSDDWKVGDLALCVRAVPNSRGEPHPCRKGGMYIVDRIVTASDGCTGLGLAGIAFSGTRLNADSAGNYRRILPHTPDAEDVETIRLLNGQRVQEPVQ